MLLAFSAFPLHRIQLLKIAGRARGTILIPEADRISLFSELLHRSTLNVRRSEIADRPALQPVALVANDAADVRR